VGPSAGLDAAEKRKISCSRNESNLDPSAVYPVTCHYTELSYADFLRNSAGGHYYDSKLHTNIPYISLLYLQ
jgi:hypothetical protein